MSEGRMESGSLDLRSLVDGLAADELDELRDAVASRLCRERYDADTIEGLLYFEDTRVEREPGAPRRRGLSKDKVCVVVAIDSFRQAMAVVSENGKPSTKRINGALKTHIGRGSTIVHDCEKAHNALVRDLGLVDERYKAVTTDPVYLEQMALVNHLCSWIRRYVERFACMRSENLQAYPDWFVYLHRVHRDEERWPVEERVVRHLALSNVTYLRKW